MANNNNFLQKIIIIISLCKMLTKKKQHTNSYSLDTEIRTLGRRLLNHYIFWKQKILKFFCEQTNKIELFNYATVENLKPFELNWPFLTKKKQHTNSYSLDTEIRTLGRRLLNHYIFWKQKILKFFCEQTNKIELFNYATVENLKPFELNWPLRKQPSNLWMVWFITQKNFRIFRFQKT